MDRGRGRLLGCDLCERNGRERLEVEEGADKRARAVSRSGRMGESGSGGYQR
jgi:hypothetical protein